MISIKPNILINRQGAGGDVLMISPIVKKIFTDRKGQCNIDVTCSIQNKSYLENNPYIRMIYGNYPDSKMITSYDVYINLDLAYEKNPKMHIIDAYGYYAIGHIDFDKKLELYTKTQDKEKALEIKNEINSEFIILHQRKIGIHDGNLSRNIPTNIWMNLIKKILNNTNLSIVQIGTLNEPAFVGHKRLFDFRNKLTISELKELIELSKLFIGSDSGPSHVAATTNTSIVTLYTSVKQEYRKPFRENSKFVPIISNIECYGCLENIPPPVTSHGCFRNDFECVNRFDHDQIYEKIMTIIN